MSIVIIYGESDSLAIVTAQIVKQKNLSSIGPIVEDPKHFVMPLGECMGF